MHSRPNQNKVIQITSIILLMGVIAWLATGWQSQSPLQLGMEQDSQYAQPWSEAHLIMPVTTQTQVTQEQHLKAM